MGRTLSAQNLREQLGRPLLIIVFLIIYTVSQVTIITILKPIKSEFIELQTTGFDSSDYLATFGKWEMKGQMDAYRAHFIFDDVHWIWYSMLFVTLLSFLFKKHRISDRYNWMLLLPPASGLLDCFENLIQHVFLSTEDFSMIIEPLPLFSTVASNLKWLLAGYYVLLSAILAVKAVITFNRH